MIDPLFNMKQTLFTKDTTFMNEDGKDFFNSLVGAFDARDKKHAKSQSQAMFNLFSHASSVALGKGLLSGTKIPEGIHPFLDTNNKNGATAESFLQAKMHNNMLHALSTAKGHLEKQMNAYKNNSGSSKELLQKMESSIALVEQYLTTKKDE
ncbi:hypothetical protein [Metasolibacillus meyeri]|uniref:hypothetical protein n=1 Tax=Metasolibacillus meyeri TaxID=1071052 RepID=UPI000D302173|nr:hypothetical protein [Metasolibacillus meyeri]